MFRPLPLMLLLAVGSLPIALRSNADLLPPRKLHAPADCPRGLHVTARPNDGMIDFVVRIDSDEVEQSDLYRGRVTAVCHLDLSLAQDRVAYTQLHATTENKQTVFRFTVSPGAAKSSHLDLNTRLHEADGSPTFGGGRTFQIYLTGFLPSGR